MFAIASSDPANKVIDPFSAGFAMVSTMPDRRYYYRTDTDAVIVEKIMSRRP
jgi:hypothetical protein